MMQSPFPNYAQPVRGGTDIGVLTERILQQMLQVTCLGRPCYALSPRFVRESTPPQIQPRVSPITSKTLKHNVLDVPTFSTDVRANIPLSASARPFAVHHSTGATKLLSDWQICRLCYGPKFYQRSIIEITRIINSFYEINGNLKCQCNRCRVRLSGFKKGFRGRRFWEEQRF